MLIRWVPSYMRLFGYFTNFILLGSLLGAGIGILTHRHSRFPIPTFALLLLALVGLVPGESIPAQSALDGAAVLRRRREFGAGRELLGDPAYLRARRAGVRRRSAASSARCSRSRCPRSSPTASTSPAAGRHRRLRALSFLSLPPLAWFALFFVVAWPLVRREARRWIVTALAVAGADRWWRRRAPAGPTPGPRITASRVDRRRRTVTAPCISVNNLGHQRPPPARTARAFYHRAYELFGPGAFKRVLLIGAGSGTDVSVALANGVEHVDAVEMDPRLYELGRKLHPDHPYDDPRVTVHIDDGRAFLV